MRTEREVGKMLDFISDGKVGVKLDVAHDTLMWAIGELSDKEFKRILGNEVADE